MTTAMMSMSDSPAARVVPNSIIELMPSVWRPSSAKNFLEESWSAVFTF
ncbi:MAG: hypothetical protein IH960_11325 [Chloroflexi bacterium]|nr:hypothetical protein [Chloroflexota bacterium]